MERHELDGNEKEFITAGNATVTFQSEVTGCHLTFKVTESPDGQLHFVKFLNGQDNENDFSYLGIIRNGKFSLTKKSKAGQDSKVYKAFSYVWNALSAGKSPSQVTIWHEGKCGRCGRTLTVPSSIATGIGPVCAEEMGL